MKPKKGLCPYCGLPLVYDIPKDEWFCYECGWIHPSVYEKGDKDDSD